MYIKKYIKPYKWQAIIGFIFKLIEALLELMVPLVVASIIDKGINQNNQEYIIKMAFVLFGLAILGYMCAIVCQYFASLSSQGFGTLMRKDMFHAINQYDYVNIDEIGTPSLITRITSDVNQMQLAVAMTIRLVSRSPFLIFGSIILSFTINKEMALIFLCCSPLMALSIYLVMSKSLPLYQKIQKKLDQVSLITRENLSGVRVIRAFSKQRVESERFKESTQDQKDLQIKVGKLSALLNPSTTIIVNIAIMLILYIGGIKINVGTLTQGEVIALINYMNAILLSMYAFANVIVIFNKANASYSRIKEVLETTPSIKEGEEKKGHTEAPLISFDDVSFSYLSANILSHITFDIMPHETVGIIGGTGSGKTTLIQLIPRFYDATSGKILVKGKPIQDYTFDYLRNIVSIVPQKAVLFKGTIKENLLWGNKNASMDDINRALTISQSKEFVDGLKNGIDTEVEQGGLNFSGGQRQRLTIARAVIKESELIILDDSASALDFKTDASLRKALKTLPQSVIIVSQRVSSLMHADKIVVLSHGEVVGIGTHDELMNNCEIYQEITRSQLSGGNQNENN